MDFRHPPLFSDMKFALNGFAVGKVAQSFERNCAPFCLLCVMGCLYFLSSLILSFKYNP